MSYMLVQPIVDLAYLAEAFVSHRSPSRQDAHFLAIRYPAFPAVDHLGDREANLFGPTVILRNRTIKVHANPFAVDVTHDFSKFPEILEADFRKVNSILFRRHTQARQNAIGIRKRSADALPVPVDDPEYPVASGAFQFTSSVQLHVLGIEPLAIGSG